MRYLKNVSISTILMFCIIGSYNLAFYSWDKGHTFTVGSVAHKMYSYDDNAFYVTLNDNVKYNVDKYTYIHASLGQECVISRQNDLYLPLFILAVVGAIVFFVLFIFHFATNWEF
jgi:hypothetical protein